jgi:hypothetical protein
MRLEPEAKIVANADTLILTPLYLFTQNFFEHCTLEQGLVYIPCQPQCSLVNTATSVTLLRNTQTHRYNHKYTDTVVACLCITFIHNYNNYYYYYS